MVPLFHEGLTNVHDEQWRGWLYMITDDLVQIFSEKVKENRRFTITHLLDYNIYLKQHEL